MSRRYDHRTEQQFAKDIKFATKLEGYFFNEWIKRCTGLDYVHVSNARDNGICNDGELVRGVNTSGADYKVDISYDDGNWEYNCIDLPLEIKWVPTPGKFSLKVGDMKAYIREHAAILFIYNTVRDVDLKKPRHPKAGDFENHIKKIESKEKDLKWGILMPDKVEQMLDLYTKDGKIEPIRYMGGRMGLVLKSNEFDNWFHQESWS
jgi:hypothetical protein